MNSSNTSGVETIELEPRILVVDDEGQLRDSISRILSKAGYECRTAVNANDAREAMRESSFALVLTDMNMPGDSGLELLVEIKDKLPDTAAIMVTGQDNTQLAEMALEVGAYGYVIKPFERNELLINVSNALRRRRLEIENRSHRGRLEEVVRARTAELWEALCTVVQREEELRESREETIERLSIAAEFRDDETAAHIHRMSQYCALLAEWIGWDRERCELMRVASIMHDIGKIGIPDSILLKPGKLSADEYETMKQHADFGYRILTGTSSQLLDLAALIAVSHHERWDGSGYPRGLKGEEIPIEGRIAAIGDVFDALTTDRIYRKAYDLPTAIGIMRDERGSHFDPELLDVFLDHLPDLLHVIEEGKVKAARKMVLAQTGDRL